MYDEKAIFGPRKIRRSDPDVYSSPDSARVRSRQIGCIGIRKYETIDGGEAWMPCTNESDFRRSTGVGPQAKRDRDRKEREFIKRVVKKKTVPNRSFEYSRIVSNVIESKSEKPQEDNRFLLAKVRNHNKEMELSGKGDEYKASLETLKAIWDKEIKNGSKEAMKRVNTFISVLAGARSKNLKYISDVSLLPSGHPQKASVKIRRRAL
jgi:hypothetical protein